jgi:RimJ/RimL family protein N-acetyltransferase
VPLRRRYPKIQGKGVFEGIPPPKLPREWLCILIVGAGSAVSEFAARARSSADGGGTMEAIGTKRLTIRSFCVGDWRDLHEMVVQYQASEVAKYDHKWPTAEDEIKGVAEWFASGDRFLAVCLNETGELIGFVALNPKEDQDARMFGLGYVFHPAYRGKGYATEAGQAVLDHAFGELGAESISTGTAEANGPSCRLLRRLGFQETGRGTGSFWKTEDGERIEFATLSFRLSREGWLGEE